MRDDLGTKGVFNGVWTDIKGALPDPPRVDRGQGVNRRGFLKAIGIGGAAALASCQRIPVNKAIPFLVPVEEQTPGVSSHYAATCTACPAACGLMMTVRDGRPIKLEGNPEHPRSLGGLCAVGQGDLRALYDPKRLQGPQLDGKDASWQEIDDLVLRHLDGARRAGSKVRVLAKTIISPTGRQVVEDFLAPFGGRLVEYDADPETASAIIEAYEHLDGVQVLPAPDMESVDLLVSIASDFLGAGLDPVTAARAYADRKRAANLRGPLRHVQIEGTISLTGAAADERWLATFGERRLMALHLLQGVARRSADPAAAQIFSRLADLPTLSEAQRPTKDLADALHVARGRSLVMSGDDDPITQIAVALVNRLLGNEGKTLDLERPLLIRRGRDSALRALLDELRAGEVEALFIVDLDPIEQLPGGADLAALIAKVPLTVALTDRPTATAHAVKAVAAAHHGLERWGDAMPRVGVLSLSQPGVRPLFDTRDPFESFLNWSGATVLDYRRHLEGVWKRDILQGIDPELAWTQAVSTGLAPANAVLPVVPVAARTPKDLVGVLDAALGDAGDLAVPIDLEVELLAEVGLREGSRSFVPWLRELPDPLTRASWMPCVRMAPALAQKFGAVDGDVLRISVDDRAVEMPVRVMPGQHPLVLGVPVGYGRVDGTGDGTGDGNVLQNAYTLVDTRAGRLRRRGLGATVRLTDHKVILPLVQWEMTTHGRDILHQVERPDEQVNYEKVPVNSGMWGERQKVDGPMWEMTIDLDSCTGCSACVVACQAENNIVTVGPDEMRRHRDMHWLRIDRYFAGDAAHPDVLFQPMLCSHCNNAPCETVCPVAATTHSSDGLNMQVYNRCVGTRYCSNNCPYKVRRFNWFAHPVKEPLERMVLNPDVVYRDRGVMEKCTFCIQRIQAARIDARQHGKDSFEPMTACQQTCPTQAIRFGNARDPKSEVAAQKSSPRAFQVLAELGIEPGITYVARVRNRPGASLSEEKT